MSELRIGDMAVVIHREGADYDEGCGPGTVGTVESQCFCPKALFAMVGGLAVVSFRTAAGPEYCVLTVLLRKIDPPGEQAGNWDDCVWKPSKEEVT